MGISVNNKAKVKPEDEMNKNMNEIVKLKGGIDEFIKIQRSRESRILES